MPGALILFGDKTTHMGAAVEAAQQSDSSGKPVARHGDKTSCGATLIASQQNSTDAV